MKINNRLLITSGLLLGLSTVAMSTATYAWFTVNKTASMTATGSIKAEAGVELGLIASGGHEAVEYKESQTINLGDHSMTDISGNGASLFKPVFASNNTSFSSVRTITNNGLTGYEDTFIVAQLKFRSDKAYTVYVGQNEDILKGDLAVAARLAIFDSGKVSTATAPSAATLKQFIYSGTIENEYYISADTATSTATTGEGGTAATGYTAISDFTGNTVVSDVVNEYTSIADADAHLNPLTTLVEDGTYSDGDHKGEKAFTGALTVVIWIDGADTDCVNEIVEGSLTVTLPFAFLAA